jgi:hypothetical protein
MTSKAKDLESKIDLVLKDSLLTQFASEQFDPSEFISSQLTSNNAADLWKTYSALMEKDKMINGCLELMVEQDLDFFNNQFTIPKEYGVG